MRFENGWLANRYLHGPAVDQVLADEQLDVSTGQLDRLLWPLADNLGSIRDLAERDAVTCTTSVVNDIIYSAYGQVISQTDPTVEHQFGFTGRELDGESDLSYYRARYYDPLTGRFASEDPIEFLAGDVNLNRYVGNGPTGATDPSGLAGIPPGTVHVRRDWWQQFDEATGRSTWYFNDVYFGQDDEMLGRSELITRIGLQGPMSFGTAWFSVDGRLLPKSPLDPKKKSKLPLTRSLGTDELREQAKRIPGELAQAAKDIGCYTLAAAMYVLPGPDELIFVGFWKLAGRHGFGYIVRNGKTLITRGGKVLRGRKLAAAEKELASLCEQFGLRKASRRLPTGQIHHPISTKVGRAIDNHPNLKGAFDKRDPRFVTRAIDGDAHRGYQRWHRDLDDEVVDWIGNNPNATPDDFLSYLRELYKRPDLAERFPDGF